MGHAIFAYLRASSSPMCGTELCRRAVRDAERSMLNLEPDKLKALAWPGCQGNPRKSESTRARPDEHAKAGDKLGNKHSIGEHVQFWLQVGPSHRPFS